MFGFGKNKKDEEVEYMDDEILKEIREVKELIERKSQYFRKMNRVLKRSRALFSIGLKEKKRRGKVYKIRNKDTINASIQLTQKLINEAKEKFEEKRKNAKEAARVNPKLIKKK
jgi:hypothetical protein